MQLPGPKIATDYSDLRVGSTARQVKQETHRDQHAVDLAAGPGPTKRVRFAEKLVTDERIRQGLLIAAAVVFVPMAVSSLFVEPSRKPEEFLPSDHPLQKIITIMSNEFPAASWDAKVTAEIVFGVDPLLPLDRKGADDLMDYRRPLSREQRLAL